MSKLNCDFIFSGIVNGKTFSIVSCVLLFLFVFLFYKNIPRSRVGDSGLIFLVSGAIVNIFERFKTGCVSDYLSFFKLFYFNFQDLLVTAGIILIIWAIFKTKLK